MGTSRDGVVEKIDGTAGINCRFGVVVGGGGCYSTNQQKGWSWEGGLMSEAGYGGGVLGLICVGGFGDY